MQTKSRVKTNLFRLLAMIVCMTIIMSSFCIIGNAVTGSDIAADGTYTGSSKYQIDNGGKDYRLLTVSLTVKNGKITGVAIVTIEDYEDNAWNKTRTSEIEKAKSWLAKNLSVYINKAATYDVIDATSEATTKKDYGDALHEAFLQAILSAAKATSGSGSDSGGGSTTTKDYVLVDAPTAGKQYIIIDKKKNGSGNVLTGTGGTATITVKAADSSHNNYYVTVSDNKNVFTCDTSNFYLKNSDGKYLATNGSGKAPTVADTADKKTTFNYSGNVIEAANGFYLYFTSKAYQFNKKNNTKVYFYELQETQTYTVTYDLNDGVGSFPSGSYAANVPVTISPTKPTKTGSMFKGWAYNNDTSKIYQNGSTFTMPSSNVTLTAQWAEYFVGTIQWQDGSNKYGKRPSAMQAWVLMPDGGQDEGTGWHYQIGYNTDGTKFVTHYYQSGNTTLSRSLTSGFSNPDSNTWEVTYSDPDYEMTKEKALADNRYFRATGHHSVENADSDFYKNTGQYEYSYDRVLKDSTTNIFIYHPRKSYTLEVEWVDNNAADRPTISPSIVGNLDKKTFSAITSPVVSGNVWTYTIAGDKYVIYDSDNLNNPYFDNYTTEYQYSPQLASVPKGYTASISGNKITLTKEPSLVLSKTATPNGENTWNLELQTYAKGTYEQYDSSGTFTYNNSSSANRNTWRALYYQINGLYGVQQQDIYYKSGNNFIKLSCTYRSYYYYLYDSTVTNYTSNYYARNYYYLSNTVDNTILNNLYVKTTNCTLGTGAVLKDVVSSKFNMPANSNITAVVQQYNGSQWNNVSTITPAVTVSDHTVTVTGFDYQSYLYFGTDKDNPISGDYKIVLRINGITGIQTDEEQTVSTNTSDSGIYESASGTAAAKFVNPVVTIPAEDKVYELTVESPIIFNTDTKEFSGEVGEEYGDCQGLAKPYFAEVVNTFTINGKTKGTREEGRSIRWGESEDSSIAIGDPYENTDWWVYIDTNIGETTIPVEVYHTSTNEILASGSVKVIVTKGHSVTYDLNGGTGDISESGKYAYGDTVHISTEVPIKVGYKFSGWTLDGNSVEDTFTMPNKDVTLKAVWEQAETYTVLWKNYDGSILKTDNNVLYHSTPEYQGTIPERPNSGNKTYTFIGWTPEISPVTGNQEYQAVFMERTNYTASVIWNDEDNYDGSRPESVRIGIRLNSTTIDYRDVGFDSDGNVLDGTTVSDDNTWTYTWNDVGESSYNVVVYGTYSGYTFTSDDSTVTFSHTPTKPYTLKVIWNDENNLLGKRPEIFKIYFNCTSGGETQSISPKNENTTVSDDGNVWISQIVPIGKDKINIESPKWVYDLNNTGYVYNVNADEHTVIITYPMANKKYISKTEHNKYQLTLTAKAKTTYNDDNQTVREVTGVTITDTLSNFVDFDLDNGKLNAIVTAQDTDNNQIGVSESDYNITVSGKNITLKFKEDFVLSSNVTYSLTFPIVVSQTAINTYLQSGTYPSTGGSGTGITSEGEKGYISNSSASVTYTYAGTQKTETYQVPVVQIYYEPPLTGLETETAPIYTAIFFAAGATGVYFVYMRRKRKTKV